MVITFSNAGSYSPSNPTKYIVAGISFCLFALVPLGFILGNLQPTGTLISPLPKEVMSEMVSPSLADLPPIAANQINSAATSSAAVVLTNSLTNSATISATMTEAMVKNPQISSQSLIYLLPKEGDKNIYFVKSKSAGELVIATLTQSDIDRSIDYQIVNP